MKYFFKKISMLLFLCLLMLILSGCWDNKDITDMFFIVGVGFDKIDEDKIEVTMQLVKPSAMNTTSQSPATKEVVWIFSSTGDTVFEAVRDSLSTLSKKSFWGHLQLIVIGEELAKEGIMDMLDFLERDLEPNLNADTIIAKGTTAKKIIEAKSEAELIPTMHIKNILKNYIVDPKINKTSLIDLLKEIVHHPENNIAIGVIEIIRDKENPFIKDMKVEGSAILKKGKLIGWLNPEETRGLLAIEDNIENFVINIDNPLRKGKKVTIEIIQSSTKTDVKLKEDKMVLSIDIKQQATIGEQHGSGDLTSPEMIAVLQKEVSDTFESEIRHVILLTQEKYKSDIFGFDEIVHRKYIEYWKQVQNDWDKEFSKMPLEIKVKCNIRRPGLIKQSLQSE